MRRRALLIVAWILRGVQAMTRIVLLSLIGFAFLQVAGERTLPRPSSAVTGSIVDIFSDGRVLISLGTEQGTVRGQVAEAYRVKPSPQYIGSLRLTAVGAKHSIGEFRGNIPRQPQLNDKMRVVLAEADDAPAADKARGTFSGGAIIDLTTPKDSKK